MEYQEAGGKKKLARGLNRNRDEKYGFIFELFECTVQTVPSNFDRLRCSLIIQ